MRGIQAMKNNSTNHDSPENQDMTQAVKIPKGHGIMFKLGLLTIGPMLLIAVVILLASIDSIRAGMEQEALTGLKSLCVSTGASFSNMDGDFKVGDNGDLYKGDYDITANTDKMDSYVEGLDSAVTVFYGDTRMATTLIDPSTGKRVIGTKASDTVINTVLKNGNDFSSTDIKLFGKNYYVYYIPMKDSAGNIIGMYFAGKPSAVITSYINKKIAFIVVLAVVILLTFLFICIGVAKKMAKAVVSSKDVVAEITSGNLTMAIPEGALARNDEIGQIVSTIKKLQEHLSDTMTKIRTASEDLASQSKELRDTAGQTNSTSGEIAKAVEDIAKGATSQADQVSEAAKDMDDVGRMIDRIAAEVTGLIGNAEEMNTAGNAETEIIAQLSTSNDKTMAALKKIEAQVNTTNESAQQISEAVSIITSIAEETNLLSLNATIEAARAGEQGRGFAVVASQIQKLAEQSNQSAESIQKIIEHLLDESGKTVEVMKDVKSIATEQQQKLVETSEHGNMVVDGICKAKEKIENIGEYVTQCGEGKNKVSDIIEGLSSISEENAAACEETTASMQELNATMAMMEEASNKLNEVSDTLKSEIAYFRISSENTIKDVAGSIAE